MTSFIKLEEFYKNFTNKPGLPQSERPHFNIVRVEDLLFNGKPVLFSRRSYFKVSLVQGHSKIHYPDQVVEIPESALVFTNPMTPYHWELITPQQTGFICIFTEDFFNRFGSIKDYPVFKYPLNSVIPIDAKEGKRFNQLFLQLVKEMDTSYTYKDDLLRCRLMEIIHEAQKMQAPADHLISGATAHERIALLFAEFLAGQFPVGASNRQMQLRTPADFAGKLNIHVNHLNKALKEITGATTSSLINSRIIQEATILLQDTTWSVNEIAWVLGFEEPNHFSTFFKQHSGHTPKQRRKKPAG